MGNYDEEGLGRGRGNKRTRDTIRAHLTLAKYCVVTRGQDSPKGSCDLNKPILGGQIFQRIEVSPALLISTICPINQPEGLVEGDRGESMQGEDLVGCA